MEKETKMKTGDKIRFTKEYRRMPFMFELDSIPASLSSSPKVFTIETIDEDGGIILEEDNKQPKRRMAPEWLELASK